MTASSRDGVHCGTFRESTEPDPGGISGESISRASACFRSASRPIHCLTKSLIACSVLFSSSTPAGMAKVLMDMICSWGADCGPRVSLGRHSAQVQTHFTRGLKSEFLVEWPALIAGVQRDIAEMEVAAPGDHGVHQGASSTTA